VFTDKTVPNNVFIARILISPFKSEMNHKEILASIKSTPIPSATPKPRPADANIVKRLFEANVYFTTPAYEDRLRFLNKMTEPPLLHPIIDIINLADSEGHTLLHKAAESHNLKKVKHLVAAKADVNALSNLKRTPLHLATFYPADEKEVTKKEVSVIRFLAKCNPDMIDTPDGDIEYGQDSPRSFAIYCNMKTVLACFDEIVKERDEKLARNKNQHSQQKLTPPPTSSISTLRENTLGHPASYTSPIQHVRSTTKPESTSEQQQQITASRLTL